MELVAVAFVSWGQWVARCPICPNAEHAGLDGSGGLTGARFTCSTCGVACRSVWPPNVDDIWRILSARPNPANRNWQPPETIHDLLLENIVHGIAPAGPLMLVGDRIGVGAELLPPLPLPAIERAC